MKKHILFVLIWIALVSWLIKTGIYEISHFCRLGYFIHFFVHSHFHKTFVL